MLEPLYLSISTDWPTLMVTGAIGLGSIMTSIAVVCISSVNQKTQNKAKSAELRYQWINDLRTNVSEFISISSVIQIRVAVEKGYIVEADFYNNLRILATYKSKIHLMLGSDKLKYSEINDIVVEIMGIFDDPYKIGRSRDLCEELESKVNTVLEEAWCNIKHKLEL
ncbi:MAG: hypothetical protein HRT97_17210 [Moritella sp.]|uniref:hypothetical protein n=1 Tax=Moritella sp. TaxID=78556 RepID=UPI0025DF636A|nr:hypothetical protein [Moritella sp.]NQZ94067.1 hypothetical protein [Moritella sp.]